jgi:hypothetical protein
MEVVVQDIVGAVKRRSPRQLDWSAPFRFGKSRRQAKAFQEIMVQVE